MSSDRLQSYNSIVYGHIRDKEYSAAAKVLENEAQCRSSLSLLAFCYYHNQDFIQAADTYDKLIRICPSIEEYQNYRIQALLKAGALSEAQHFISKLRHKQSSHRILMIQLAAKIEEEDLNACKAILNDCVQDEPETMCAHATVYFKEGKYEEALSKYSEAFNMLGFEPSIAYNIALCHYMLKECTEASEIVAEIIDRGNEQYPVFDTHTDSNAGDEQVFFENSTELQNSYLIEAYNLKAAIEYDARKIKHAKETLQMMPQRRETDLDPVTLHNDALFNMHGSTDDSFKKLSFLLSNPPFPPVTFGNLLSLYCQHGYNDVAADILAENSHLTFSLLDQEMYDYLDASIMITASPDEAITKFESLYKKHSSSIRSLKKESEVAKNSEASGELDAIEAEITSQVEVLVPVLMAMASIHWEREDYTTVEQVLRRGSDLCSEHDAWKLNVAHSLFVQQGSKFKDCIEFYEPFVLCDEIESLLDISPIALANLCVAYIMTNQNEEAEDIMKRVEIEEISVSKAKGDDSDSGEKLHHGCIINLVIGTLYCEKGNFEFGISRICKSLQPYDAKLGPDTWHYAKRCLIALADKASKRMLILKASLLKKIIEFLDEVSVHGRDTVSALHSDGESSYDCINDQRPNKISSEALKLKSVFLQLKI